MCKRRGPPTKWSLSENSLDNFLFLKRKEDALIYQSVLWILEVFSSLSYSPLEHLVYTKLNVFLVRKGDRISKIPGTMLETTYWGEGVPSFQLSLIQIKLSKYSSTPVTTFVYLQDISQLSALDQSFRSQCDRLRRTSQSHYFVLRGKETNFFGSKFAIDSSTPLSKGLLHLYLTFKSMRKAKIWRYQYCRVRSIRRCQHLTSEPFTAN